MSVEEKRQLQELQRYRDLAIHITVLSVKKEIQQHVDGNPHSCKLACKLQGPKKRKLGL